MYFNYTAKALRSSKWDFVTFVDCGGFVIARDPEDVFI